MKMDENDPDFDQDETVVALEEQRASMFQQEICRRYGRSSSACQPLINNTIRWFQPERRGFNGLLLGRKVYHTR
jgi:hypothetical protein